MWWNRTRTSCSCCSSVASVVQALQRENERLTAALTAQNDLLGGLLRKATDAALTPGYHQIERIQGEQRTEQAAAQGEADDPPPPAVNFRRPHVDDDPIAQINIPSVGGGYGA